MHSTHRQVKSTEQLLQQVLKKCGQGICLRTIHQIWPALDPPESRSRLRGQILDPQPLQKDPAFAEASSCLAHRLAPSATVAAATHVEASHADEVQECTTG